MLLTTAYIHMKRTQALEDFAMEKIESKLTKLAKGPIYGNLTFLVENGKHRAKLLLKDRSGTPIKLERQADNMYEAVARLGDILERLLRRRKTRNISARQKSGQRAMAGADTELDLYEANA